MAASGGSMASHRLALGAAAVVVALAGATRADDAADKFKADITKLTDRYTDAGKEGRLGAAIKLCKDRVGAAPEDVDAKLSLARFELAKEDFDAASATAEDAIAKAPKDGDQFKKAHGL